MRLIDKKGEFVLRDVTYCISYFVVDDNGIALELLTNSRDDIDLLLKTHSEYTIISLTDGVRYDKGVKTEFNMIDWVNLLVFNIDTFDLKSQSQISAVLIPDTPIPFSDK